jgi:hypothetical protein
MSSSLPLALAALLGASAAAWAADQPDPGSLERGAYASPAKGAGLASAAAKLVASESAVALRPAQSAGQRPLPFLELRLGRASAFGQSPAVPPPAYGEVGIDIDPRSGVSLVPSYRIVLDDGDEGVRSFAAQILKLGVRMRF